MLSKKINRCRRNQKDSSFRFLRRRERKREMANSNFRLSLDKFSLKKKNKFGNVKNNKKQVKRKISKRFHFPYNSQPCRAHTHQFGIFFLYLSVSFFCSVCGHFFILIRGGNVKTRTPPAVCSTDNNTHTTHSVTLCGVVWPMFSLVSRPHTGDTPTKRKKENGRCYSFVREEETNNTKVLGDPSEGGRPTDETRWPSQPLKVDFSLSTWARVRVPFQVNATPSVKPKIKTAVLNRNFYKLDNFKHGSFVISTSFHEWEKIYKSFKK